MDLSLSRLQYKQLSTIMTTRHCQDIQSAVEELLQAANIINLQAPTPGPKVNNETNANNTASHPLYCTQGHNILNCSSTLTDSLPLYLLGMGRLQILVTLA